MNPTTGNSPLLRRLGAMRATAPLAKEGPYLFKPFVPHLVLSTGYHLAWVMLDDARDIAEATKMLIETYPYATIVLLPVEQVLCADRQARSRGFVYIDLKEPDHALFQSGR
jgi:hypothetical protein